MNPHRLFKIFRTVGYRAYQAFVCGPAIVVAIMATALAMYGESPIEASINGTYAWAEASVRPVSVGQLLVRDCVATEGHGPTMRCTQMRTKVVDASAWISATSAMLRQVYLLIATGTAIGLAMHLGWRRFTGLTDTCSGLQSRQPGPADARS